MLVRKHVFFIQLIATLVGCLTISSILANQTIFYNGVSGCVVDKNTSQPLHRAIVFIHWQAEVLGYHRAPGQSLMVYETTTDERGHFTIPSIDGITTQDAVDVRIGSPYIGITAPGYGIAVRSLLHEKVNYGDGSIHLMPLTSYLEGGCIAMSMASNDDIFNQHVKSNTRGFINQLQYITRSQGCLSKDMPLTTQWVKQIMSTAKKRSLASIGYQRLYTVMKRASCETEHK